MLYLPFYKPGHISYKNFAFFARSAQDEGTRMGRIVDLPCPPFSSAKFKKRHTEGQKMRRQAEVVSC